MNQVSFNGLDCKVQVKQFYNGRPAIVLTDAHDGSPVTRVSINVPDEDLEDHETVIRDYGENAGVLEVLVEAGVVSKPTRWLDGSPVCDILIDLEA